MPGRILDTSTPPSPIKADDLKPAKGPQRSAFSPFLRLPTELLHHLSLFLPPASFVSLALSHPLFFAALPPLPLNLSKLRNTDPCSALAIRSYKSTDRDRLRCRLCKEVYPLSLFECDDSESEDADTSETWNRRIVKGKTSAPGLIRLPPRVCTWHRARLCRVVILPPPPSEILTLRNLLDCITRSTSQLNLENIATSGGRRPGWYSRLETLCLHCGFVKAWEGCECECESCGEVVVRTYTRYTKVEAECGAFTFFLREGKAPGDKELWVRERSVIEDGKAPQYRELPVQFD